MKIRVPNVSSSFATLKKYDQLIPPSQVEIMSQQVGAMPAPDGVTPDFHGSTHLQHTIIVVYSVTFALATLVMILRLYTGAVIVGKIGWDSRLYPVLPVEI